MYVLMYVCVCSRIGLTCASKRRGYSMYSKYALPGKLFCLASVRKTLALPENVEGGTVQLTYKQITC